MLGGILNRRKLVKALEGLMGDDLYIFSGDCFVLCRKSILDRLCQPQAVLASVFWGVGECTRNTNNKLAQVKYLGCSVVTMDGLIVGK